MRSALFAACFALFATLENSSSLLSSMPPVSTMRTLWSLCKVMCVALVSRVVPAIWEVMAMRLFAKRLKREDLPTFGLPMIAIVFIVCLWVLWSLVQIIAKSPLDSTMLRIHASYKPYKHNRAKKHKIKSKLKRQDKKQDKAARKSSKRQTPSALALGDLGGA